MRLMVAGDLHGNTIEACSLVTKAKDNGLAHIMQVGDFGIFPKFNDFTEFLDGLNTSAKINNVMVVFTEGNHDDIRYLRMLAQYSGLTKDRHFLRLRTNIYWSPRGNQWSWAGKRFMTVGGAVSVDRERRLGWEKNDGPQKHWFPDEQVSEYELHQITTPFNMGVPKPVDYLFTHDCPTNAPFRGRLKEDPDSQTHRQRMDVLGRAVKPHLWFHGHMHTKYDGYDFPMYESHTKVYGLEADFSAMGHYATGNNWGVLDTDDDSFTWGPEVNSNS